MAISSAAARPIRRLSETAKKRMADNALPPAALLEARRGFEQGGQAARDLWCIGGAQVENAVKRTVVRTA